MNAAVVGHGMTGVWHSHALQDSGCRLHTIVGRRREPTRDFARRYGYTRWATDFAEVLDDQEIDLIILANPSELHAEFAAQALESGKHTLVEIPLAMSLAQAERLAATARACERNLGVVHPLRFRPEMIELRGRIEREEERVRHVNGRFFIHRLENVGATGYRRSWTDSLLWHHMAHLVDFGMWMLGERVRTVQGLVSPPDPRTGIPMDVSIAVETENARSLVCTGSYYGRVRIFELLVVTDRDSYLLDVFGSTLTTGAGVIGVATEEQTCALVTTDFVASIDEGGVPLVPGSAVLPAMSVLQDVQNAWDSRYGARSIPGRSLDQLV